MVKVLEKPRKQALIVSPWVELTYGLDFTKGRLNQKLSQPFHGAPVWGFSLHVYELIWAQVATLWPVFGEMRRELLSK